MQWSNSRSSARDTVVTLELLPAPRCPPGTSEGERPLHSSLGLSTL